MTRVASADDDAGVWALADDAGVRALVKVAAAVMPASSNCPKTRIVGRLLRLDDFLF
jgi:hypothetical protein